MLRVEPSVPAKVSVFESVSVLDVVPPAIVKPVPAAVRVSPLTLVGVIAPSVSVIAGVVVAVATVPEMPFAVATDTVVTVPLPPAGVLYAPFAFKNVVVPPPVVSVTPFTDVVVSVAPVMVGDVSKTNLPVPVAPVEVTPSIGLVAGEGVGGISSCKRG